MHAEENDDDGDVKLFFSIHPMEPKKKKTMKKRPRARHDGKHIPCS